MSVSLFVTPDFFFSSLRRFLEYISMGVLMRDAYPASDVLSQETDAAAKMAITRQAVELLCCISEGQFGSVLSV